MHKVGERKTLATRLAKRFFYNIFKTLSQIHRHTHTYRKMNFFHSKKQKQQQQRGKHFRFASSLRIELGQRRARRLFYAFVIVVIATIKKRKKARIEEIMIITKL